MHVTVLGKASNTREAGAVILYGCQNSPENSNFYLPAVLSIKLITIKKVASLAPYTHGFTHNLTLVRGVSSLVVML